MPPLFRTVSLVVAVTTLFAPARAAETPDAGGFREEDVLVERVRRPLFVEPPRCRALTPADVVVEEDGQECRVTAVSGDAPPHIHAVLVDNSLTMRPHVERLARAVRTYLDGVPESDAVLLATFADHLALRAGLTDDRDRLFDALGDLGLGYKTALRDALYWTVRYLEPRPERKVVVLFTDAFDNASLGRHSDEAILELVRGVPDLSLFTIHVDDKKTQIPSDAALLERLSRETGGEYFHTRGGGSLGKVFAAIRDRLDGEIFVTYEPPPFGSGPLDEPDRSSFRLRELTARAAEGSRCNVTFSAPTRRAGDLPPPTESFELTKPDPRQTGQPAALAGVCPIGRRQCFSVLQEMTFAEDSRLWLVTPQTYLAGSAPDVTAGRGARYDPRALSERKRFVLDEHGKAEWEVRDFRVETPPYEQLEQRDHSLVDVLERWMRRGGGDSGSFVHGQTWLEIREPLAHALYHARIDYRNFADRRMEDLREARVDRLLSDYTRGRVLETDELEELRALLARNVEGPGSAALPGILAEWIGDVTARDLALGLEARIADLILALPDGERAKELKRLDDFWVRLREWFPPPTTVRVVTPMVPLYDPARNAIGFQRVLLPRVSPFGGPLDDLPEYPFGARLVNRLLSDRDLRSALRDAVEVSRIEFRPVFLSGLRSIDPALDDEPSGQSRLAPHGAFEHKVHLLTHGEEVSVSGYFERQSVTSDKMRLHCMKIEPRRSSATLWAKIRAYLNESGLACGSAFEALPVGGR